MKPPSLSVVIALYNHADVVPCAIESVLRQSRPPEEIVIVDDASTDCGVEVIEEIAAANPTVRLIRSKQNQGTPRATNRGYRAARGDYVYALSADDFVLPGFFETAMNALQEHPQAGLSYGDFLTVTQGLEILERTPSLPPVEAFYSPDDLSDRLYGDILEARGAIFQREAVLACGGLIPELEEMSDWYLGLAVAFRHGLYYSPGTCHAKRVDFTSYALKRQACRDGLQEKIHLIVELLERPENRDLLPHFARSAAFLHFGIDAAEALLRRPECWGASAHRVLLHEPLTEYMRRKRERVRAEGRTKNRPHFARPASWQKHVAQYTPEFLVPRVDALVEEWNRARKRVLIYGAGEHTVALFKLTSLRDAQIVGIADRAETLHGEQQWGFEVIAPWEISSLRPDVVLISSAANQDGIYQELGELQDRGIELVRLYGEDVPEAQPVASEATDTPTQAKLRPALKPEAPSLRPEWLAPRVSELVSSWVRRRRRVVLLGAGEVTSALFKWTNIAEAQLVAIAEPVTILQGKKLWNLETVAPDAIRKLRANTILVCLNNVGPDIRRELATLERDGFEVVSLRSSSSSRSRCEVGSAQLPAFGP